MVTAAHALGMTAAESRAAFATAPDPARTGADPAVRGGRAACVAPDACRATGDLGVDAVEGDGPGQLGGEGQLRPEGRHLRRVLHACPRIRPHA